MSSAITPTVKKNKNKRFRTVTRGGGVKIRILHQLYRSKQKQQHKCEMCLNQTLIRLRSGIWNCKTCNHKITGGAYELKTSV